jgi:hypothetical protein
VTGSFVVLTFPCVLVKKVVKRIRKSSLLSQALKEAVKSENKVRQAPLRAAEKALDAAVSKLKDAEEAENPSRKRIARRQETLKAAQEALEVAKKNAAGTPALPVDKLKQHVETRWNSVFVMLERLVLLRAPVVAVCTANTGEATGKVRVCVCFFFNAHYGWVVDQVPASMQLSDVEWQRIVDIKTVLRPFYDVTRLMCSSSHLTLSWFGAVVNNLLSMCAPNPNDDYLPRALRFRLTTKVCNQVCCSAVRLVLANLVCCPDS